MGDKTKKSIEEKINEKLKTSVERETGIGLNMVEQSVNGHSDLLGSYTGVSLIDDEQPEQDPDDL